MTAITFSLIGESKSLRYSTQYISYTSDYPNYARKIYLPLTNKNSSYLVLKMSTIALAANTIAKPISTDKLFISVKFIKNLAKNAKKKTKIGKIFGVLSPVYNFNFSILCLLD